MTLWMNFEDMMLSEICLYKRKNSTHSRSLSQSISSVTQLCLTPFNPMDCSTPGFPVHHHLPELAQTHGRWVSDAIWCHQTISSSAVPFSSCPQSFPASGSFPVSWFFASGGQSIGALASTSVLPRNIQNRLHLGWTGWISLPSKGLAWVSWRLQDSWRLLRVFSNATVQKHQFFGIQPSLWSNSHIHAWLMEKP